MTADTLTVEAGIIPSKSVDITLGSDKYESPDKERNWLMKLLEEACTNLVMDIADSIGLADLLGESGAAEIAKIITDVLDAATKELVEGTGLEDLLRNNPYDQLMDNLDTLKKYFVEDIPDRIKENLGYDKDEDFSDALEKALDDYVKTDAWDSVKESLQTNLLSEAMPHLLDYLTNPSGIVEAGESLIEKISEAFNGADGYFDKIKEKIGEGIEDVVKATAEACGVEAPDEITVGSTMEILGDALTNVLEKSVYNRLDAVVSLAGQAAESE